MPSTFDDNITLAGTAGYSTNTITTFETSVTFTSTNTFALTPNNVINLTRILSETANFTLSNGPNIFQCTLNLPRFAGFYTICSLTFTRATSNTLSFSHGPAPGFIYSKSIIQTLTFTQLAARSYPESVTNTIVFTQQVSTLRIVFGNASSHLTVTQNANRQMIYNRNIENILNFQGGMTKRIALNSQIINIPTVFAIKKPKECVVILEVPQRVIVLPCPLLGDGQSFSGGKVDIKKSVNDDTLTYIRHTNLEKLKYTFNMEYDKAKELLDFVANFGSNLIYLTNFKAEFWLVLITNQPLEFVVKSRPERTEVTLEFEGIQIG